MEGYVQLVGFKGLLSDLRIEEALYIRCLSVCLCGWHFLSSVWLKERCSNPFTEPHPIDNQLLMAASAIAESFHMWITRTAQDCQSKGLAQGPGSATGNWMALDKIFNYLCSLCLICKVICPFVSKFWRIYRQLVLETQFINRICMIYHFLKCQYFSDSGCSVKSTVLSSWMGGQRRKEAESLVKILKVRIGGMRQLYWL